MVGRSVGPARDGDPRGRCRDVPGQGAGPLALRAVRRGLARGGPSHGSSSRTRSGRRSTRPASPPLPAADRAGRAHRRRSGRGAGPLAASRRGLLGPEEFMPVAEDTGRRVPIGRFALEQALRQLAQWRAAKPDMRCRSRSPPASSATQPRLGAQRRDPRQRDRPRRGLPGDPRGRRRRGSRRRDRALARSRRPGCGSPSTTSGRRRVPLPAQAAAGRRAQDPPQLHPRARRVRRGRVDRRARWSSSGTRSGWTWSPTASRPRPSSSSSRARLRRRPGTR